LSPMLAMSLLLLSFLEGAATFSQRPFTSSITRGSPTLRTNTPRLQQQGIEAAAVAAEGMYHTSQALCKLLITSSLSVPVAVSCRDSGVFR
jgi:hypothetical protein